MNNINTKHSSNAGFTLAELLLAITLGAMILASLTMIVEVCSGSWRENNDRRELMQHARVAMSRMMEEVKYAVRLQTVYSDAAMTYFTIYTRRLINGNWVAATVTYRFVDSVNALSRQVGALGQYEIAGSDTEGIRVTQFNLTPLQYDGGVLIPVVIGTDEIDLADALEISLELHDENGESFTLTSMASFRNKITAN